MLNASAALAMLVGFVAIRQRRIAMHRACMLTAVGLSVLFLCSYLVYHAQVGSRPYGGEGGLRTLYLSILLTHTVLAVAIVPLVVDDPLPGPAEPSSRATRAWPGSRCRSGSTCR